jgi:thiol-disulfide isomerase/thioredoxin
MSAKFMKNYIWIIAKVFALLIAGSGTAAHAETKAISSAAPTLSVPDIQGVTSKGEPFSREQLKGKVAVVFYWSTDCTVCMNSLPELRANAGGWSNKPFVLVTVNVDRSVEDWAAYERILAKMQISSTGVISLRQVDTRTQPAKLPLTLLLDAQGKLVSSYAGRLALEVWDGVADLIP